MYIKGEHNLSVPVGHTHYGLKLYGLTYIYTEKNSNSEVVLKDEIVIKINLSDLAETDEMAQHVIAHEVGHALLLNHTNGNRTNYYPASVMTEGIAVGVNGKAMLPTWYDIYNLNMRW